MFPCCSLSIFLSLLAGSGCVAWMLVRRTKPHDVMLVGFNQCRVFCEALISCSSKRTPTLYRRHSTFKQNLRTVFCKVCGTYLAPTNAIRCCVYARYEFGVIQSWIRHPSIIMYCNQPIQSVKRSQPQKQDNLQLLISKTTLEDQIQAKAASYLHYRILNSSNQISITQMQSVSTHFPIDYIIYLTFIYLQMSSPQQCPHLVTSLPSIDCSVGQLGEFQQFLASQIEQLQQSTLSRKSCSNVVAVQNSYGMLKDSIINYYFQQRAARKRKDLNQITAEVTELRNAHAFMKHCIQKIMKTFHQDYIEQLEGLGREMTRLEEENKNLKCKLRDLAKAQQQLISENNQLRRNLQEWEEAKSRRKTKQLRKDEPSVEKIEQIIKNKLREDSTPHMTPLKEFNMQNFMSRKVPSFNFASSMAENKFDTQINNKFRGSSISDTKNHFKFSSSMDISELQKENQRRKSKQKLKVVSIDP